MPTKAPKTVAIRLGIVGQTPSRKTFPKGTTVSDIVDKFALHGMNILVNGRESSTDYRLEARDTVTAVVKVKGGRR